MQKWVISIIETFGYIGIFLLILLENIFPPIPSEIILTFSGFMTSISELETIGVITVSTLGAYIGAVILYVIGRSVDYGKKILKFKQTHLNRTYQWFEKYGNKAVFIGRLVPVVRSLISIPAGMSRMAFIPFSLYTIIGTLIWNTILTYLGVIAGENYETVSYFIDKCSLIVVLMIIGIIIYRYLKKKF